MENGSSALIANLNSTLEIVLRFTSVLFVDTLYFPALYVKWGAMIASGVL